MCEHFKDKQDILPKINLHLFFKIKMCLFYFLSENYNLVKMAMNLSKVFDYFTELIQLPYQRYFSLAGQSLELNRWLSLHSVTLCSEAFRCCFQRMPIKTFAFLKYLLFLRISLTWTGRIRENSQMAGLQPGLITESQEWSCVVFCFSLFLFRDFTELCFVFFFAFMVPFWVCWSKDSEAKIPCNTDRVCICFLQLV